jgi:hypothetical protein
MLLAAACTIGAALSGLPACCMGLVGIDACRREFGYECSDVSEDAHIVKRLARQYDPTAQDYISDFRGPISLARMQLLLPHSGSGSGSGSAQKSQLETRDSSHMRMRKGPQGQGRRVAGVWELAMRRMRAKQALRARKRARREQREREKVADSAAAALLRERANRRRHSRL